MIDCIQFKMDKRIQLCLEDGRLQSIKTGIHTDADIVIFVRSLPVDRQRADQSGQFTVISEYCPSITITSERLSREKAGGSRIAKGTAFLAILHAAEALGSVFQNLQTIFTRNRLYACVVGWRAK